jgi:hypothetical protein
MNVKDMFPSKFLSGADLAGRQVVVTIATVKPVPVRDPQTHELVTKYVLYFTESKTGKGLILNKTLAVQIARALGAEDTEAWTGKRITLYPESMTVAGVPRVAIRARAAANGNGTEAKK